MIKMIRISTQTDHLTKLPNKGWHMLKKLVPGHSSIWCKFLSNTANQSNHTVLVTCIGASFWYSFLSVYHPL